MTRAASLEGMLVPRFKGGDQRLPSIDIWRGINIMFVIASHLFFGLYGGSLTGFNGIFEDPFLLVFGIFASVGQMFFFLSGVSQVLSMEKQVQKGVPVGAIVKKEIKKGLFLILVGLLYDPVVYWHFGTVDTLHMIGLSYIVLALLYMGMVLVKKPGADDGVADVARLKRAGNWFFWGMVAVVVASPTIRLLTGWYPIVDPSVEPLVYAMPPRNLSEGVQAWITTSFFPVFPWIAYFFAGAWIATRIIVAGRSGEIAKYKLAKSLALVGFVVLIVGIGMIFAGEEIAGTSVLLPQNLQPGWVIELSFNVQPLTTCTFVFYLGMSMLVLGLLSFVFEVKHTDAHQAWIYTAYTKLRARLAFNTWAQFSYYSLTIYILQYTWIPVLRVLQVISGGQIMYTIPDTLVLTLIVVVAWILFAFVARWLNTAGGNRFTFEGLVEKVSG